MVEMIVEKSKQHATPAMSHANMLLKKAQQASKKKDYKSAFMNTLMATAIISSYAPVHQDVQLDSSRFTKTELTPYIPHGNQENLLRHHMIPKYRKKLSRRHRRLLEKKKL